MKVHQGGGILEGKRWHVFPREGGGSSGPPVMPGAHVPKHGAASSCVGMQLTGSRSWYPQFQRWGSSLCSVPPNASVPGPCDPEDLLDGVIFGAKYLGSTQLASERNPPTSVRMAQAQEAVDRIKVQEGWGTWLPQALTPVGVGQRSGSA